MISILLSLLTFSYIGFAQVNTARLQGISVSAENFSQDTENQTVELIGQVQIVYEDQHLTCDRAIINLRAKSVDAQGKVLVVTPRAIIGGNRVILDYGTDTGIIFDGYVQSGNVLFEGNLIRKLNNNEYLTSDSYYTTCNNCPETWGFSGTLIRAELGGYAYIKNSVLKMGGVPIFWLPYMMVPLKSDRQTGLLTPGYERSDSGGFAFYQPFFWAMSQSQDSTWTLKNYELRGLKGLLNYRYVLTPTSSGELDASFLRDRVFASDSRLNQFRPADQQGDIIDRWTIKYNHHFEMPEGYTHRMSLNNSSDLQYPKDFTEETGNHGDSAMESRMNLTKNTNNDHWLIDISYYKNLLQSNPLADNSEAVHRFPEISYSRKHTQIGETNLVYSLDANYINLARTTFSYDDLNTGYDPNNPQQRHLRNTCGNDPNWEKNPACQYERDGAYDPSVDLIRTGQRLDLEPAVYYPIKSGYFELLPKMSYRETIYSFDVGEDQTNTRRYIRGEISARTTLSRIYGDMMDIKSDRVKHEIQPQVTFTTIPWMHHPEHPFFGSVKTTETQFSNSGNISDGDLNGPTGIQFDYNDRIYDRRLVTLGILNRWIRKQWRMGIPHYHQFLTWGLTQSYDAYQADRDPDSQPWSDLVSDLRLTLNKVHIYHRANYFSYQQVTNTSFRIRLLNDYGDFVELGHLLSYTITPKQDVDIGARNEEYSLTFSKDTRWANLIGQLRYDANVRDQADPVKSWGYGAQFKLPGDCLFITLKQYRVTRGDTIAKIDFEFFWDGNQKPKLDDSFLSQLRL